MFPLTTFAPFVAGSSTESFLPILEPTMSVAQLDATPGATKAYEMKRSAMFSSQSSFGSRVNSPAAPASEVTSYSSEKRESSQQLGNEPVIHVSLNNYLFLGGGGEAAFLSGYGLLTKHFPSAVYHKY